MGSSHGNLADARILNISDNVIQNYSPFTKKCMGFLVLKMSHLFDHEQILQLIQINIEGANPKSTLKNYRHLLPVSITLYFFLNQRFWNFSKFFLLLKLLCLIQGLIEKEKVDIDGEKCVQISVVV